MATPGNFIKTPGILLENSWNLNFKFGWPPCYCWLWTKVGFLRNLKISWINVNIADGCWMFQSIYCSALLTKEIDNLEIIFKPGTIYSFYNFMQLLLSNWKKHGFKQLCYCYWDSAEQKKSFSIKNGLFDLLIKLMLLQWLL